jgi:3D (Asp-Asp-Asp) domain-containing protein
MNKSGRWILLFSIPLLILQFSPSKPTPKKVITNPSSKFKIKMKGIIYLSKCYYKRFDITSYTVGEQGVNYITASGRRVNTKYVACPKRYKFGTRFIIWGKTYYCYDRGGLINKYNRIDVFLWSKKKVRKFGIKRKVKVKVCQRKSNN